MYLKRLDVQGFKSFANKTSLDFGTGVTCIIGPNGTGKTNVADAIRWVLGEHASRTLRARKTEDVIFAGSDKRSSMGVAEVHITLDNSEQWLPIEFDEVVVARRAYRSGDNEYYINGARVRLKDVVELFMRAQVGQNSYAFMGQGMVEQVLSLRPEDRRGLIEEAADVRLYRTRLQEAQHRLSATRDNLDRVQMLVREIEPRINQLERQAGRAVKYRELTNELASTLHVWYSHQWQDVNAQLLAAITSHDQQTEDFERTREQVRTYEEGLAQLRAAIDERRNEIATREARLANMLEYARDLERRAGIDDVQKNTLAARLAELDEEIASLAEDQAAQEAASTAPDTAELEAQLETARADLAARRARLAEAEQELAELRESLIAGEQATMRAKAALDDLTRRASEATAAIERLEREREAAAAERRGLVDGLAAWAKEHAASDGGTAGNAGLAESLRERDRADSLVTRLRSERAGLQEELISRRAESEALRMRIELIEAIEVRPQAPDGGVRALLEAGGLIRRESTTDGIELQGVVGLLGQILRVPPGLERAIEAALAENLFAVVMERQADLRAAVDLLLGGDAGRATLYALDNIQELRPLHLIKERGIVGVASQLVRCAPRHRKLVDTVLGRTVVVNDLPMAYRVVRRGMASAVATLDGVLLRPVGAVSAGTITSVQAAFVREREADEGPARLAELGPVIAGTEGKLREADGRLAEAETRLAELDAAILGLRDREGRLDAAAVASKLKLAEFRTKLASVDTGLRIADEQLRTLRESRARAEAESEQRARDVDEAETRQQEARERLAAMEPQRAAMASGIDEQGADVARLDGVLRSERQIGGSDRMAIERLARQIETKQAQRAKLEEDAHTVATRLGATQRELTQRTAEIEALRAELDPARRELAQFESRERSFTTELAEAGARLRTAESARLDAENSVRVRRDELETLRQNLEAEGFVAGDDGDVARAPEPEPEPEYADEEGAPPTWLRTGDEDLPPVRGGSAINPTEVRDHIADLRAQIRSLGPVNEQAADDYEDSRNRYDFLTGQLADLQQAEEQLNGAIGELESVIRDRFRTTFKTVNQEFERYFSAFFRGGTARLELGETDDDGLPGIEIVAQPPGKKLGSLALLSGGERSLTAVALLFALLQANPSPICVLDEVDAALDEANVGRFVEELRELAQRTQFIIITHNRRTIEQADTIYGVSMGADSVSRVLSLRLADVPKDLDA